MDLVAGANTVVIATNHADMGKPKLVKACTLPITGFGEVDIVVTEMSVFFFEEGRFILKKIAPDTTVEEIRAATELHFDVAPNLEPMIA